MSRLPSEGTPETDSQATDLHEMLDVYWEFFKTAKETDDQTCLAIVNHSESSRIIQDENVRLLLEMTGTLLIELPSYFEIESIVTQNPYSEAITHDRVIGRGEAQEGFEFTVTSTTLMHPDGSATEIVHLKPGRLTSEDEAEMARLNAMWQEVAKVHEELFGDEVLSRSHRAAQSAVSKSVELGWAD